MLFSFTSQLVTFALECPPIPVVRILVIVVVVPTPLLVFLLPSPVVSCSVSLLAWLKGSVSHDVCSLIEVIWSSCGVLSDSFEFLICLKSVVNGNDVENDQSHYNANHECWLLLDEASRAMRVLLYILSAFDLLFSLFVSYFLCGRHVVSCFTVSLFVFFILLYFSLTPILFIFTVAGRFRSVLVVLVRIGIDVSAVSLPTRQFLALLCLEVVAKDDEKLEAIEQNQDHVDNHIAVVESTEAAP